MANGNLLELLPPRETAQPARPATTKRSRRSDSSSESDSSSHFKHKLARKLTALESKASATSSKTSQPPTNPAEQSDKNASDKPATDQTHTPVPPQPKKSIPTEPTDIAPEPNATEPKKSPESGHDPVAPATSDSNATDQAKPKKQSAGQKAPTPPPQPNTARLQDPTAKAVTATTDPQTAATSSDSDSSPDSVDGITPAGADFYGSGKVVGKPAVADGDAGNAAATAATEQQTTVQDPGAVDGATDVAGATAPIGQPAIKQTEHDTTDQPDGAAPASPLVAALEKSVAGIGGLKNTASAEPSPQARFVEANQPKIISGIQGQLLPHGGTMQIRLDPPELGPMQVSVHMKDGVMTASFETTSEHATKLLSHSLSQLKSGLETAGMNVQKLEVQQSPRRDGQHDSNGDSGNAPQEQQQQAQQEKQRREMVQRMWRKLAGGDPLDMVA